MEEDLAAQKENSAHTFAFKAYRCFYLAESYMGMKKWAEAVGLLDRAQEHVTQAMEHYRELEQTEGSRMDKVREQGHDVLEIYGVHSLVANIHWLLTFTGC